MIKAMTDRPSEPPEPATMTLEQSTETGFPHDPDSKKPVVEAKRSQRFSLPITVLAVVVILAIIGFAGWIIYERTNSVSMVNHGTTATGSSQVKYLDIKEIGVRIPLDSSTADVVYAPFDAASGAPAFGISAQSLVDQSGSNNCSAASGPLGLVVATTNPTIVTGAHSTSQLTPDNKTVFKFGRVYVRYIPPQNDGCSSGHVTHDLVQSRQEAFALAFAKLRRDSQVDPYSGWQTYVSPVEKITFQYPADWTVDSADALRPNDPNNTDYTALKSPDGKVVVHWMSEIDGFGDEYGTSYPYNEIIDKAAIPGAVDHYVISGITTLNGQTYYPWIAAEDSTLATKFSHGVAGNIDFFMGLNNINPTTNSQSGILFSTSGPRTNNDEPGLTKADATAYLSNADMQLAKKILLSFHY